MPGETRKYTTRPAPVDVEALIPELAGQRRPAVRLHPRRAERPLPHRASKIGGLFLGNDPDGWPRDEANGTAYVGVLQLLAEDFPELEFPAGKDVLQLLWSTHDRKQDRKQDRKRDGGPDLTLRWLDSRTAVTRDRNPPFKPHELLRYVPKECALHPERIEEYPDLFALGWKLQEELDERAALIAVDPALAAEYDNQGSAVYQFLLGAAPGCKLGGHPDWVQGPQRVSCAACGDPMQHLLTMASVEWDGASCRRWKPIEDGAATTAEGPREDAGLTLGDNGDIYVFSCRKHDPWRGQGLSQSS
jgi:hypothetical protein